MTILRKPVARKTNSRLDGSFGPDRNKAIVVKLIPGTDLVDDLIELRPERTRRAETISVSDVYRFAVRCRVQAKLLERARDRKAKLAQRRADARQRAAERRLRLNP